MHPRPLGPTTGGVPLARAAGRRALLAAAGVATSVALSAGWIAFRSPQRTVVAALLLVTATLSWGAGGRRAAVVGSAVGAALGFTFFDTPPYESFAIARPPDLATAAALLVVGLLTGELAVRFVSARRFGSSTSLALRSVRGAAALLASGEELVVVLGAVAEQIVAVAALERCTYSADPLPPAMPVVGRGGEVSPGLGGQLALPVWALGEVVGHFLLTPRPGVVLRRDALLVAGILADQAGAALAVHALPPPLPPAPGPGDDAVVPLLRVVPGSPAAPHRRGAAPGGRAAG
ncbi:MAG TPA: DUF4118 domain-containing protein [Acidimicrobiales bacterium]|nr:DUF4118 domain-containing protein [Acidimicrobiales bacterium]